MNKILISIIAVVSSFSLFSQDAITDELKSLVETKQYDKIITEYAINSKDYSDQALYYIGLAYYMKGDDVNTIKFMNISIKKNSNNAAPYYIKANSLQHRGNFKESIKLFQKAIKLRPEHVKAYVGLGDSYYELDNKKDALKAYKKATEKKDCPDKAYIMIAQIYSELNQREKALESLYNAKKKVSKDTTSYLNILFNIAQLESQEDKAADVLVELIELAPTDYQAQVLLIRNYYHQKKYDKAKPYKENLYKAHKEGLLKNDLEDMFPFDRFTWKNKVIYAYERFEEDPKKLLYPKHLFYVLNDKEEFEQRIQTEYSSIHKELNFEYKYLLALVKEGQHATFNIGFNDDFNYDELKEAVIDILEGKVKPLASSKRNK